MASLAELARIHTSLSGRAIGHLQRLVAGWGLLADFCFADLLLFIPTVDSEDGDRFVVLGQVRPSTSQTVYRADWIGTAVDAEEPPLSPGPSSSARSSRARPDRKGKRLNSSH